jgi:acyl carrier protein
MNNHAKLQDLLVDVLLLEPEEYSLDLSRSQVDTWDSLAVVSIAVGVDETFGYHPTPDEATAMRSVRDIIRLLESKGITFDD